MSGWHSAAFINFCMNVCVFFYCFCCCVLARKQCEQRVCFQGSTHAGEYIYMYVCVCLNLGKVNFVDLSFTFSRRCRALKCLRDFPRFSLFIVDFTVIW